MITYHNGDLLGSKCDIICHQVNLQGIMGGGIALQIARKYPGCESRYKRFVKEQELINLGAVFMYRHYNGDYIANCFTQDENFNTDYSALSFALKRIKDFCEQHSVKTVGFPHGYGCGIANGNWEVVEGVIKSAFENTEIDCQIWRFNNEQRLPTTFLPKA